MSFISPVASFVLTRLSPSSPPGCVSTSNVTFGMQLGVPLRHRSDQLDVRRRGRVQDRQRDGLSVVGRLARGGRCRAVRCGDVGGVVSGVVGRALVIIGTARDHEHRDRGKDAKTDTRTARSHVSPSGCFEMKRLILWPTLGPVVLLVKPLRHGGTVSRARPAGVGKSVKAFKRHALTRFFGTPGGGANTSAGRATVVRRRRRAVADAELRLELDLSVPVVRVDCSR